MHRIIEVHLEDGTTTILYDAPDATYTDPEPGVQALPIAPEESESNE